MKPVGRSLVLAALLGAISSPALVHANGRFPTAQHVLVGPGPASSTIVLRTTFGFVVSDDSGATFHWICELALGYPPAAPYDPPFALDALGRLHVGVNDPGQQTLVSTDRCTFATDAALDGQYLEDLDNTPDGQTLVSITSSGDPMAQNRVYRSDDQGSTWRGLGVGQPVLYETVEVAPSNTQRVYATATLEPDGSTARPAFYRSDDGGATLTQIDALPAGTLTRAFVAGVDPTTPDTVFVRALLVPPVGEDAAIAMPTALLRSHDGGTSWQEIARSTGAMDGFAISDDGRTVWWGGPDAHDGLQRSDDGGDTFSRVGDTAVLGLRQHGGVLYVVADYIVQPDHFALYRSHDRGATLEPLLALGNILGAFACAGNPSSPEVTQCAPSWPTQQAMLPPAIALDAGVVADASGAAEMAAHASSSCGCRTPAAPSRVPQLALTALAAAAAIARRRRPRR